MASVVLFGSRGCIKPLRGSLSGGTWIQILRVGRQGSQTRRANRRLHWLETVSWIRHLGLTASKSWQPSGMPRTTIRHHARQLPPDSVDEDNLLLCLRNYCCHEPLPTRSPAIKALVASGAFCDGNNGSYSFQSRLPHQSPSSETSTITF